MTKAERDYISRAVSLGCELWRPVIGWEQFYEVSNFGNVRSLPSKLSRRENADYRCLSAFITPLGYPAVNLSNGNNRKQKLVHRIVLEAFSGPSPEGCEACHNNGDRSDARLSNLRWDTRKNNHADKKLHGTSQCGEKNGYSKLTATNVDWIRSSGIPLKKMAEILNVSKGCISKAKYMATWRHL